MKILKIEFENLNSLRGVKTIDLENGALADAGIFAITGPTGAGKSTILDAITLALYGKAARYGTSSKPENMMSRHTGHCRAEIEFEVPGQGRFRSAWHLNRARKKPDGKVQGVKQFVYDADGAALTRTVTEAANKVEELIGLDFDRFLRSVLLAQGEFAKFLKSDVNERSRLLESLTGTTIYSELSQLVHEERRQRQDDLSKREAKLDAVVLLTETEITEKQAAAKQLTGEHQKVLGQQKKVGHQIALGKQLAESLNRQVGLFEKRDLLEKQTESLAADEQRLKTHQRAVAFKPDLGRLDGQHQQAHAAASQMREAVTASESSGLTLKSSLAAATEWLSQKNTILQGNLRDNASDDKTILQQQAATQAWLEAHANDAKLTTEIPNLRTALAKLAATHQQSLDGAGRLKELSARIATGQASLKKTAQQQVAADKQAATDQQTLSAKQKELTETLGGVPATTLNEQRDQLTNQVAALTTIAAQQEQATEAATALAQQQTALKQQTNAIEQRQAELKLADERVMAQSRTCDAHANTVQQAQLVASFSDHRANLADGQPCPLCGALEHPADPGDANSSLAAFQKQLIDAKEQLTALQTKQQRASKELIETKAAGKTIAQSIQTEQTRSLKLETAIAERAKAMKLTTEELADLLATQTAAETRLANLKRQMDQIHQLQESLQQHEQTMLKTKSQLDLLAQTVESTQTRVTADQTQQTKEQQTLATTNNDVRAQTDRLNERLAAFELTAPAIDAIAAFEQALDQRHADHQQQQQQLTDLTKQLEQNQRTREGLEREQKELDGHRSQLNQWLADPALAAIKLKAAQETRVPREWPSSAAAVKEATELRECWSKANEIEIERKAQETKLRTVCAAAETGLLAKVVAGAFMDLDQLRSSLLPDDLSEQLAGKLNGHQEQLTLLQGQLKQSSDMIAKLQADEAPEAPALALLEQDAAELEKQAADVQRELTTLENELANNQKQRDQQATASAALQAERQQLKIWQRMHELIGSSDGKRFRAFAQGLSLDLVVRHANRHLAELSKRYRLHRSGDDALGLEICDRHQANAMRPMESLSGGESFVVSLALALGLSDLAGQSVRIDSLFIDEGFGTLDPETLDMAVAALERLQASNKMIGVISHVELLKERITTQIQVVPGAGGTSELRIVA